MPDQWMVRVEGKEYGPVDTDTLREWKTEGRLIRTNELRRVEDEGWLPAAQFPEIFADDLPAPEPPDLIVRRRTWPEIFRETIRIYRGGFWRFMMFGLLTAAPMFVMQWYFPRVPIPNFLNGETMPAVTLPHDAESSPPRARSPSKSERTSDTPRSSVCGSARRSSQS